MFKPIEEGIKKVLKELGLPEVVFSVEHPKELSNGDYASNVALIVDKQANNQSSGGSVEIAENLVKNLKEQNIEGVESIEVAGPGFINFTLKREVFVKTLEDAQDPEWGNTKVYEGKKILVEHSSPNLFKPFHIGHLMNNTVGESLYRLAKSSGAKATPISFPSDISLGVAKAVFILLEKYGESFLPENVSVLGDAYVEGTKRFDEDESIHARVKEIADNLYASKDSPELIVFKKCKKFNVEYFEIVTKSLGSEFDSYIYESEAGVDGKKIVLENVPKVFTESEGAIVYIPEEGKKLHTAVFINSQGNPTYEAKDIGLLHLKFNRYQPDISITVTDNQQTSHFQVVIDAGGKINPQWESNSVHRSHGRMSFKGQKMSSRLGNVPLVEDILGTVVEEVKEKNPDVTNESAQAVGISAIKFTILRTMAGKDINFDPETSLSFEGDSGPYLQYTAVRAGSLLEKGKGLGITPSIENPINGTETLERLVARFLEIIERSQTEWAPHYIVTYLSELAQEFNSWYGQGKIIDEDEKATAYRLYVVSAVRQTLINGLWALGIEVPDKM
jgi:arginyl-tRNA synthetase